MKNRSALISGLPLIASVLVIAAAALSILGLILDRPEFGDWIDSGISIKFNTALAIACLGVGLFAHAVWPKNGRWLSACFGVVAAFIGGATVFEHLSGLDLGIDNIIFPESLGQLATVAPGRMGPPASTSLFLLGLALVLLPYVGGRRWSSYLSIISLGIASVSLVGYIFGADQLYAVANYTGIAFPTAAMIAALGVGIACAVPEYGLVAALKRDDAGGLVFRRLVIPALAASLIMGWLRAEGQHAGLYDTEFGTAARTIFEIYLLLGLLWFTTNSISKFEAETHLLSRLPAENPEPVIRLSDTGKLLYQNYAAASLAIDWFAVDDDVVGLFKDGAMRALSTGERINAEVEFGQRLFDCTFTPILESKYINIYCGDITERRRSEVLEHARAAELAVLYRLSDKINRATTIEEIYDVAIDAIISALYCTRVSILLFDENDVMSFVAWRDLSPEYRAAVNGHSPWQKGDASAEPFAIDDIERSEKLDEIKPAIKAEGIAAMGFVPLIASGSLIGKFMLYYDTVHEFSENELELANTIGNHIAYGVDRRRTDENRRHTEAALRENDARLRLAMRTGKVGVWDWDIGGNVFTWSESLYAILGVDPNDFAVSIESFSALIHEDDRARVTDTIQRALFRGASYEVEFRAVRPDGNVIWLFTNTTVLRDGAEPVRMIGATIDITDRKLAEIEAKRFARIVETSRDAIISKNLHSIIQSWNPAAERMFGYSAAEAIGRPVTILIPQDRMGEEGVILSKISRGEIVEPYETIRLRKDGSIIDVSLTISPMSDASGKIVGASKFARDITEQKAAEAARRESEIMHRLVGAQESERHRIARDLHDHLGQQLTGLRLKLESMRSKIESPSELADDLVEVQKQASRIDRDVNYLSWELRPTELDQLGLKDALSSFVREWSANYGIEARFHASDGFERRFGPEAETNIYRIVQEGLNNILKHADASSVEVLLEQRIDEAVLIIEDDGKGFIDGQKTRSSNGSGGLGLVGIRERAALLGGTLEIESHPGRGTSIFARIPLEHREKKS